MPSISSLLPRGSLLCVLLASPAAFGQVGDGRPVSASPFVEVHIDEENACVKTGDGKRATAEQLCGDWSHEQFPAFKHPTEKAIHLARLECVNFYRIALRLQNIFCSYTIDVVKFDQQSKVLAQKQEVGEQNVSQNAVAADNRAVAGINKKYLERISVVGQEFYGSYPRYLAAIGKVNSHAGHDFLREGSCHMSPAPTNLDLFSPVPGHVRQSLAIHSHATASTTYHYIMEYTRYNVDQLRKVKQQAEANAEKAEMNELGIPTQFERALNTGSTGEPSGQAITPAEGAIYGAFQDLITRGLKAKFPRLSNGAGSIVGGGIILVWQYYQNKRIMLPETAATFIGMVNPYAGMAANVLVGAYRTSEQNQARYREFCKAELKTNGKISAPELVIAWGKSEAKRTQNPKAEKVCEDSGKMAAACFVKRAQGMPAYSGDNCELNAQARVEARQLDQQIQALARKLYPAGER